MLNFLTTLKTPISTLRKLKSEVTNSDNNNVRNVPDCRFTEIPFNVLGY